MQLDEEQLKNSDKPWQFKKGTSGNPKGRPKKSPELKSLIQNIELDLIRAVGQLSNKLEEFDVENYFDQILKELIDRKDFKSIFWMLERVIGKPRRAVDIEVRAKENGTGLENIPTDKLLKISQILKE